MIFGLIWRDHNLNGFQAKFGQARDGLQYRVAHLRVHAVADEALVNADAQATYVLAEKGDVVGHGPMAGGRVVRVMPGDNAQKGGCVGDAAGNGSDVVQRFRQGEDAVAADACPYVGLRPTAPLHAAGKRMEPPVSVPSEP